MLASESMITLLAYYLAELGV